MPTLSRRANRYALGLAVLLTPLLASCAAATDDTGPDPAAASTQEMAQSLTLTDGWVKAAEDGMTGVFGVLENHGSEPVSLTGATGDFGRIFELHETVPGAAGSTMMQAMSNDLEIPAGESHEFLPGGDHIMVMELSQPLISGEAVDLELIFADSTRLEVSLMVKDYSGAQEVYVPDEGK